MIFALSLSLGGPIAAQESSEAVGEQVENEDGIGWGFEADFNSRYVWRGLSCSEGAVVQPSIWVTARGVTFTVWANRELEDVDARNGSEVDYSLSWEREWHGVTFEPCIQMYTFPDQEDCPSTTAVDLRASWPLGPVSLFTTQSIDVSEYSGAYYGDLGLCFEKELGERAQMETSLCVGWASAKFNEANIGPRKAALNLCAFDAGLTYTTRRGIYFRPHISVTRLLDRSLREAVDDPDIISVGVAVGMEF